MFDGTLIQNRDISKVPSVRRNPILADVFTHLEYMEKRGSGLKKICDLSASLDGYKKELHPEFTSEANVFYTTIKNVNYPPKDEIGGVNMGSSDANMGSSKTNMGSSSSQHDSLVAIVI
jgi:predicted HTH transcriptional regulator